MNLCVFATKRKRKGAGNDAKSVWSTFALSALLIVAEEGALDTPSCAYPVEHSLAKSIEMSLSGIVACDPPEGLRIHRVPR